MISCIADRCVWQGDSFELLYCHLRRMHDQLGSYKCNVSPCDRTYSSITTFRLHHRKHFIHHPAIDSIRIRNQADEEPINSQAITLNERENDQQIHINDNPVPSTSSDSATINLDFLTKQLKQLNMGFTLKWLSKSDLPRKVAFELRSDIEKYYIDPFRKAFESVSAVEPVGNLTKQLLDELKSSVDDDSEYMFIQRLKQQDLLSEPSLFTIDNELGVGVLRNEQQLVSN